MPLLSRLFLSLALFGFVTLAFSSPPADSKPSEPELGNLPNGMKERVENLPSEIDQWNRQLEALVREAAGNEKFIREMGFGPEMKKILDELNERKNTKHNLSVELDRLWQQERSGHGEMFLKDQTADAEKQREYFRLLHQIYKLEKALRELDAKDIAKFKGNLKGASPLQSFHELAKDILDKELAVQALEAQWDQSLLAIYMSQKLNRLLDSPEFCRRAAECSRSGGMIGPERRPLKGVMEKTPRAHQ